jgi:putative DNA primase/helicase
LRVQLFVRTPNYVLNCENKVLVLHPDHIEVLEHDADMLLSQLANVKYEPGIRCERWEQFVDEVMEHDAEKVLYLQKLFGLCLTGNTSLEKMWFLYGGTTRNGKSTMLETVQKMLGTYSAAIRAATLATKNNPDSRTASPDIAKLAGKRLVVCSEPPKRMPLDTALIKNFTGNDEITARFLNQGEFSFYPRFKLLCNTNYLPVVTDTTIFKSGRVEVVEFNKHFSENEQDKTLKEKLSTEESLSGVLNWCIAGWVLFNKEGLEPPKSIVNASNEYANNSDKIQLFLDDTLEKCPGNNLSIKEVYEKYESWCDSNGLYAESKQNFIGELKTKGVFKPQGTVNGRTVKNIVAGFQFIDEQMEFIADNEPTPFD